MIQLKKYSIHFGGVRQGNYNFEFVVKDNFFSPFPMSRIKQAEVFVKIKMNVKQNMIELIFNINGVVMIDCDICLDKINLPINYNTNLKIDFGEENSDITNVYDQITLAYNETEVQLAQHIYEYIHLSIPTKVVHQLDKDGKRTCNKSMLSYLEKLKPIENEEKIDPRWEKLKHLYN